MRRASLRPVTPTTPYRWRGLLAALIVGLLAAGPAPAGPPPPSQGAPPPRVLRAPPPPVYVPGPPPPIYSQGSSPDPSAPPPLPIAMRVIYAPFYVAGLILRYGVYYLLIAPLEVLGRTLDYGVEGGVEPDPNSASR